MEGLNETIPGEGDRLRMRVEVPQSRRCCAALPRLRRISLVLQQPEDGNPPRERYNASVWPVSALT